MHCSPSWTSACEEIELGEGFCKLLVTPEIVLQPRFRLFKTMGVYSQSLHAGARVGALLHVMG